MADINEVLARFRAAKNLRFDKEVAELLGLSPTDFSNRKIRGTLIDVLETYALRDGMDVDWLLGVSEGKANSHSDPAVNSVLAEIIDLEGIDQPMRLSKKEALTVVMLRGLTDTRRQQYYDAIAYSFLAEKRS